MKSQDFSQIFIKQKGIETSGGERKYPSKVTIPSRFVHGIIDRPRIMSRMKNAESRYHHTLWYLSRIKPNKLLIIYNKCNYLLSIRNLYFS